MEIRLDLGSILAVFWGLVLFGILYNLLMGWMEKRGYLEGLTSLAVVGGVLITLAGIAVVSWNAAVLALAAFTASGLPMVIGSLWRYVQRRQMEQEEFIGRTHDTIQGVAE